MYKSILFYSSSTKGGLSSIVEETQISSVEDILGKRMAELEKKIFGLEGRLKDADPLPTNNVIDNLLHVNTLISTALSGREKINTLMQRFPELQGYMDSDFEPTDLQTEVKLEYLLAMEPEIRDYAKQLQQLKESLPVLEGDRFKNLPEMSEKLNNLSLKYIELGEEAEKVNAETRAMMSRYNEIITNISKSLITLDAEISDLEKAAEPKKVMD